MINGVGHILVVDDDQDSRESVVAMLEARGYRVSAARGGAAMRNVLAADDSVDAVLLDASMREGNNAALRQYAERLQRPVVMMSGSREAVADASSKGMRILEKPFRIQQLLDALGSVGALAKGGPLTPGGSPGSGPENSASS